MSRITVCISSVTGVIQGVSLSCYGVIQGVSLSCYLRGEACQVLEKTVGDLGLDSVQVYKCTSVQVNDET
jgi:hypothetical protein